MLSSAKIGTSSWRYYANSVARGACEYYAGAGEAPGRWVGRGLGELGLSAGARVVERELEALFARALHPVTGRRLGRRWRADGVTGFDLTFSAPKSASVLWALGDKNLQRELAAAHRAGVVAALAYLDTHAAVSRRGVDGVEQVATAGLVAALFDHRTSRAGDPQLHTHALVLNKVRCADGIWRTIDGHEIYGHKKSAGAVYQAALRAELAGRLGIAFETVNAHAQAEIAGIPPNLVAQFSKRTAQITAEAGPVIAGYEQTLSRGLSRGERAVVVKTAVLATRPVKVHTDTATLHGRWTVEAAALGWDGARLSAAVRHAARAARPGVPAVGEVLEGAVTAAGRRRAVFSRADLVVELAARLPVRPGSAEQVRAGLERLTDAALARADAVPLGAPRTGVTARRSDRRYASAELLAAEAAVLDRAARGRSSGLGVVARPAVARRIAETGLDDGQAAAVLRATTGGEFLTVLTAPAGAGKTTALGAASRAWADTGYRVVGLAPSARAAAELTVATGRPADTLAKWLQQQHRLPAMPVPERRRWAPTDRSVLIVDEAGMASTFDLDRLTAAAEAARAKVVLVGDPAQIGVVAGPGGLLAALAHWNGAAELTGVHRFTQPWERQASLQLRRGDPSALDAYTSAGRVHPAGDTDGALDAVFTRWSAARTAGADALMMARTRADVDQLNARARAAALAAGQVRGPVVRLGGRDWQAGDVLRTRRNDRRLPVGQAHVRNGDRYRVLAAHPEGLLVERLTGGRARALLPAGYVTQHGDYGWACTIDGAQGATTDVGILLARPGLDREHLYVGLTRGRTANHVHVTPDHGADHTADHQRWQPALPFPDPAAARGVLEAALGRSGAQEAAHVVRDRARAAAATVTGREQPVSRSAGPADDPTVAYRQSLTARYDRERERAALAVRIADLGGQHTRLSAELAGTSRWWRPGRRAVLTERLADLDQQLGELHRRATEVDRELTAPRCTATASLAGRRATQPTAERPPIGLANRNLPPPAPIGDRSRPAPADDPLRQTRRRALQRLAASSEQGRAIER